MSHTMSKEEYTAAIEDNIKFLKEHLSEELFNCLWTGHIIAIMKESIKLLYDNQPSLPSNLDEAAFAYSDRDGITAAQSHAMSIDFKAGAKWMARQGVSAEAIANTEEGISDDALDTLDSFIKSLPKGDKVIFQIRKA